MSSLSAAVYRFEVGPRQADDPRSFGYLQDAHALGMTAVRSIRCRDLYFVRGVLSPADLQRLAQEILCDPVTEDIGWQRLEDSQAAARSDGLRLVEVALRPGVTDPVAEQIARAAREAGIPDIQGASTGLQFQIDGALDDRHLHLLARRLLANAVIQHYALGAIKPSFPAAAQASAAVEIIPVRSMEDEQLMQCSRERRAALDIYEMRAVRAYFQREGRDPTDVEFESIAQTWSEHCVHKTFKARIQVQSAPGSPYPPEVDSLMHTYLRSATRQINAPWVISAFSDNAGIIAFDDEHEVSFKVETHNHPSAIEPFGGANTGVGGVIRDVMGVSAKPIANTDVLCFGPQDTPLERLPEGVLHPRRILSGVVAGVQDYGNKMGIPTVNGALWFDPGYTANPLVYCGCVGIAPRGRHRRSPQPGDRVIVLGGRTGRDGLRGATFSSMTMDAKTGEVAGASVQIGAPITEKGAIEVILRARDQGWYDAITDCGAGGLSSAVGEMASTCGAEVELEHVHLKYPGLAPWEIWLSEAQERMVLAVPPAHLADLQSLCDVYDVELTDIGRFNASGRLIVRHAGRTVLDLDNHFLHESIPQRSLTAAPPCEAPPLETTSDQPTPAQALLQLLAHANIASKAGVIRIYDHEVQGGTRVKPLTGAEDDGPADACVLKPPGTRGEIALVLSNGLNPEYGKLDPYRMAVSAVDEAVRNALAVGADPRRIAILDNFCWGDPLRPTVMWSLLEAARGCRDAALLYATPFISGKDSLNNEYLDSDGQRRSIPATLLISAIGVMSDQRRALTSDFKQPDDFIYLLGEHQLCFGGSHYAQLFGLPPGADAQVPGLAQGAPALYAALHAAVQNGLIRACHDLSEGGLAVALAEMCIGGRLGAMVNEASGDLTGWLFAETNACLLVEVAPEHAAEFERVLRGLPCQRIGRVSAQPVLTAAGAFALPLERLLAAWRDRDPGEAVP